MLQRLADSHFKPSRVVRIAAVAPMCLAVARNWRLANSERSPAALEMTLFREIVELAPRPEIGPDEPLIRLSAIPQRGLVIVPQATITNEHAIPVVTTPSETLSQDGVPIVQS